MNPINVVSKQKCIDYMEKKFHLWVVDIRQFTDGP